MGYGEVEQIKSLQRQNEIYKANLRLAEEELTRLKLKLAEAEEALGWLAQTAPDSASFEVAVKTIKKIREGESKL